MTNFGKEFRNMDYLRNTTRMGPVRPGRAPVRPGRAPFDPGFCFWNSILKLAIFWNSILKLAIFKGHILKLYSEIGHIQRPYSENIFWSYTISWHPTLKLHRSQYSYSEMNAQSTPKVRSLRTPGHGASERVRQWLCKEVSSDTLITGINPNVYYLREPQGRQVG